MILQFDFCPTKAKSNRVTRADICEYTDIGPSDNGDSLRKATTYVERNYGGKVRPASFVRCSLTLSAFRGSLTLLSFQDQCRAKLGNSRI